MPYLNTKYVWNELFDLCDYYKDKEYEYITFDSIDEMMKNLEGEIIEAMD